jgi:phenylacetate-CoA ligase
MIAYPSALLEFARFCSKVNQKIDSLHAVICSAESLLDHDREELEDTLHVRIYNRYGCREVGDIAQEAPGVPGLLVNSDRIFVEILDENGDPCGPNEQGEVVVTDLENYGMPLIRYRIGDYARWADTSIRESLKYPFPVLASVDGRTLDIIRCPGGQRVGGTFWTRTLLRSRPGIKRIQIIQEEPETVQIFYQRERDCAPDYEFYRQKIADKCGPELRVEFIETDKFEYTAGRKFRLVICRL